MDPAVLGTLRIGLDAIDAEARSTHRRRSQRSRRARMSSIRTASAALLRRTADALEPSRPGGVAPEAG